MELIQAIKILKTIEIAHCEQGRYRQRDRLQHMLIPLLEVESRDKFERAMNQYFGL